MGEEAIVQISAFPGWIVGVSRHQNSFLCWVINPALLNDRMNHRADVALVAP